MGRRGPAPKPTNLNVLQGNPGKRQLNTSEPTFKKAIGLKPPTFLDRLAKKEWKRVVPLLEKNGLLTEADTAALAAYCQNFSRWVDAEKLVSEKGYTYTTDKGNVIQRPEVGIANTAMKLMKSFAQEFGLTPSSRTNLSVKEADESEDPFVTFMRGGKSG
ncbi:phage terminase, small subunit, putative, P27 family [Peptoclostridium litorale DSM 5388]|uniref:Phage terminase, small subunit P27 family n=1 Tax=Peptoclostridium litorale DSM 5388 TaxID=1121324 RepID=A0A069RP09_PEPLI|nr:phage terminase small subunit P27 family [Peptoclostridium litorale]KDR95912.1 phage terminase, small subunit P27 family [Peptoclostridium litorale DSM 5388]SIO10128.1 phage terminase, small subunit, putative, P27 family [Peptoclostridium litorale DSM 5388]